MNNEGTVNEGGALRTATKAARCDDSTLGSHDLPECRLCRAKWNASRRNRPLGLA
jgi:hypothetical protein